MFSFLFYGPTYMNILNIYALCRMDDISWGTKGLDASSSGKNAHLKESWRIIKFIHVSKYVFWNIVCGVLLLSFGASYLPRFFITLAIVIIIGVTMLIKVLLGAIYMVKYRCSSNVTPSTNGTVSEKSAVDVLREQVKQEMMKEIEEHLKEITKK